MNDIVNINVYVSSIFVHVTRWESGPSPLVLASREAPSGVQRLTINYLFFCNDFKTDREAKETMNGGMVV